MERNGQMIYWEINDFKTTKQYLTDLGFEAVLPRNDSKAALIKALRIATKGNDRFYKRFVDTKDFALFAVVNPEVVKNGDDIDIDFEKELVITLDKSTGTLTHRVTEVVAHQEFFSKIQDNYRVERGTVDAYQFRLMVTKFFKTETSAIPMRSRGGIYFVDSRHDVEVEKVQNLFDAFRSKMTLHNIPMFNNNGTLKALKDATVNDIQSEIDTLIQTMDTAEFSSRHLTGREKEVTRIIEKVKFHRDILQANADSMAEKLGNVQSIIGRIRRGEVRETFLDMLEAI